MDSHSEFKQALEKRRRDLTQARVALETARNKVALLEAELRGWEGAAAVLALGQVRGEIAAGSSLRNPSPDRTVRGRWAQIMKSAAGAYPAAWSFEDWEAAAAQAGKPIHRASLRSQMSTYTQWGFVERVSDGVYRITKLGAAAAGSALPAKAYFGDVNIEPPPGGGNEIDLDVLLDQVLPDSDGQASEDDDRGL